jgi:signal transduction histidine kinase
MRKSELERIQILADIGLLTPSIIHHIRSYLTAIKGNAQIGERLTIDPNSAEKFRKIAELVDRATDMIESFRKFYKGESEKERFVLADILNFAVFLLKISQ